MFAACGTAVADICWPLSRSFDSIFTCIWKFSPLSGLHCGKSSADEKQMRLPAFVIIQIDCNLVDSLIYLLLLSFILNSGSGYFHCVCVCVELLLFRFWMEGRRGGRGGGASCYGIPKESRKNLRELQKRFVVTGFVWKSRKSSAKYLEITEKPIDYVVIY